MMGLVGWTATEPTISLCPTKTPPASGILRDCKFQKYTLQSSLPDTT